MSKLKEYNGHFCESEYEYAFIAFLERGGMAVFAGKQNQPADPEGCAVFQ